MAGTDGKHYFLISAHTDNPNVFYDSNVDSGYSVDNLPPIAPANVMGNVDADNVVLHWNPNGETDLTQYEIYRSNTSGFDPDTMTAYATTTDTTYTDTHVSQSINYYYGLRAVDVHGNRSAKSDEVAIILVAVNDVPKMPAEFALHQNYPNPFNPTTVIRYQLPVASYVNLTIYNVLGQEVTTLVAGMQDVGYKSVVLDVGSLANGVYLYRITAGTYSATRKMVVLK